MTTAIVCPQCHAPAKDDAWINCPYCGTLLSKPVLNPNKAVTARQRFDAAQRAAESSRWMQHKPDTSSVEMRLGFGTLVLAAVCLGSAAVTVNAAVKEGWIAVLPAALTAGAVLLLVLQLRRVRAYAGAPLDRRIVVWRDERTQVSGGDGNSSAHTTHYALLEDRDGERVEFKSSAALAGAHAPGDIGLAYLRGGFLLDFRRIDV